MDVLPTLVCSTTFQDAEEWPSATLELANEGVSRTEAEAGAMDLEVAKALGPVPEEAMVSYCDRTSCPC